MLVASGISHRFGDRRLFNNLELSTTDGVATVIVGPSGSGKSTLLAILGGLITAESGVVRRDPPANSDIAWVLQGTNNLSARSVIDNAALLPRLDGERHEPARARAMSALAAVGLTDHVDSRARTLSGGENQRLCVARALASTRPLLLADEPTSQLDRSNARMIMNALTMAAATGRTVIVVTHDTDAVPVEAQVVALTEAGLSAVSADRGSP